MNGYNGKILRVNLSDGAISVDEPDESFYRRYLGGRGFISYFLLKELPRGADALSPENKLIFATGPITGVPVAGSGRNSVGAKSPLTDLYGNGEVGGYWGAEFKHAGYDALVIEGRAENPVYLWIKDGQAEIRDARHLWGKTTGECEKLIKEELGDRNVRLAQIGVAGENLVRYACVINDLHHVCGRCGIGAVMGSKKLRAIAVRGHGRVELANAEMVSSIAKRYRDKFKDMPYSILSAHGTAGAVVTMNTMGALPTRNFRESVFEGASKISVEAIEAGPLKERRSCYACPVRCKPVISLKEPYNVDPIYGGPEYETLASLGSLCGVDNLEALLKGNELCNANGLDTISTGVTIAFAMECFERGILTKKDTGGLELKFGNAEALLQLIEMIARKEGFGKVLAEGSARAAQAIGKGAEEFAMHVKRQEIPMHDPRFVQGMGLGYTLAPTGADHNDNIHDAQFARTIVNELNSLGVFEPLPMNDLSSAKVRLLYYGTTWRHMINCLVACNFLLAFDVQQLVDLVRATTGWPTTAFELMKIGERCLQMTRAFNIRQGMSKEEDKLPERFFTPFPSGPLKGVKIEKEAFEKARDIYYDMVGWDKESGAPTLGKLQELDIEWVARV